VWEHVALEDDLRAGRNFEVDRLAFDQLDGSPAQATGEIHLLDPCGDGRARGDRRHRLGPDGDRQRHRFVPGLVAPVEERGPVLDGAGAETERPRAVDDVPIDPPVDLPGIWILRHVDVPGTDVSALIHPVDQRRREPHQVDVVAFDDVFLARGGLHQHRRERLPHSPGVLADEIERVDAGGQVHGERESTTGGIAAPCHAVREHRLSRVPLDVFEQQGGPAEVH
jgi:hypothetical protein